MRQHTLSTVAATLLAVAPLVSAGMYPKSSPVLQVDAKTYDSLIAKSNYTSVSATFRPIPSQQTTPIPIPFPAFKRITLTCLSLPYRLSNSTPRGAATVKTSSPPTRRPPRTSRVWPRSPPSTVTMTPTSLCAVSSASRGSQP